MPWIIDYQIVLEQMRAQQLKCLYYNSGAFAFQPDVATWTRGWIGPADETIKPQARGLVKQVSEPYEATLASLATRVWREHLSGRVWVMPMSHWAYELEFGGRAWLPALLEKIEIDPGLLSGRNNAAAIEFSIEEATRCEYFFRRLLEMLVGSDFMLAFPRRDAICTLHHHKQLWWTTSDEGIWEGIEGAVPANR